MPFLFSSYYFSWNYLCNLLKLPYVLSKRLKRELQWSWSWLCGIHDASDPTWLYIWQARMTANVPLVGLSGSLTLGMIDSIKYVTSGCGISEKSNELPPMFDRPGWTCLCTAIKIGVRPWQDMSCLWAMSEHDNIITGSHLPSYVLDD